jgi:hypothetical protein
MALRLPALTFGHIFLLWSALVFVVAA